MVGMARAPRQSLCEGRRSRTGRHTQPAVQQTARGPAPPNVARLRPCAAEGTISTVLAPDSTTSRPRSQATRGGGDALARIRATAPLFES